MIFLDTNILIEHLKGNSEILAPYPMRTLFVNDIVVMELYQGARNRSDLDFVVREIAPFKTLTMHDEVMKLATTLIYRYKLSHNLRMMDAMIAATVLVYGLELLTLNRKDFRYIPEIKLV